MRTDKIQNANEKKENINQTFQQLKHNNQQQQ